MTARDPSPPLTMLSVGHVTHDRYGGRVLAGGSAFYAARTARELGARSRLMTSVGRDFECSHELVDLETHFVSGARTTTFDNEYSSDGRRTQWIEALAPIVAPDLLPSGWRRADVLFIAPVMGEVELAPWLDAVRAPLAGVGLQGFLRRAAGTPSSARRRVLARAPEIAPELYDRIDVVFMSEEDVGPLPGKALLDELRAHVPLVVVTRGEAGSTVFTKEGEERVGIYPVTSRDPTGAGDTYAAAFLFRLARGGSISDAARFAAAAASIVVEGQGGVALRRLHESYERCSDVGM